MRHTLICIATLACCTVTLPAPAVEEEQAPPAPEPAVAAPSDSAAKTDAELESVVVKATYMKNYMTCVREVPTGSILMKSVCRNRALQAAEEEATRIALARMRAEQTRRQHTQFMKENGF